MNSEPTTAKKIRRLPFSYAASVCSGVFGSLTIFGAVFMLFLDELKLQKTQIGLLLSLFPFCGILALFVGPLIARVGAKRMYLTFWTGRKLVVALLIVVPWVAAHYGPRPAFIFVGGIVLVFSICRAVAETAYTSWFVQIVPNAIRGRYTAVNTILGTFTGLFCMGLAALVLRSSDNLSRFIWLFVVGVTFGLGSVVCAMMLPGGGPEKSADRGAMPWLGMLRPLKDAVFRRYLIAMAIVVLGFGCVMGFIPLYFKDKVGLASDQVVLLAVPSILSVSLSAIVWGWAADRYGSKPVMLCSLLLYTAYPLGFMLIPRNSGLSWFSAALVIFVFSAVSTGWGIGSNRLLFNSLIPPEHRTVYAAVYYAWMGLCSGIGPLVGGWVLDKCKGIDAAWMGLHVDAYSPLFAVFVLAAVAAALLLRRLPTLGEMPALAFAGMFFRGWPFGALSALISYNLVGDEVQRVLTTERLGKAKSPLNVDELIGSLKDPSFNVRYESIISMARTRQHPRITSALIDVLVGNEPDLSIAAAWALGRIGDRRAIEPLREQLVSGYPLLAARSARALAMLGDQASVYLLLARLRDELDEGVRIAFAAALGALKAREAVPELLQFLDSASSQTVQRELTLALARIIGREKQMILLLRRVQNDQDTALARAVHYLPRKVGRACPTRPDLIESARDCDEAFANNESETAVKHLAELIRGLARHGSAQPVSQILEDLADRLGKFEPQRVEYVLLAIEAADSLLGGLGSRDRGRQ